MRSKKDQLVRRVYISHVPTLQRIIELNPTFTQEAKLCLLSNAHIVTVSFPIKQHKDMSQYALISKLAPKTHLKVSHYFTHNYKNRWFKLLQQCCTTIK